METTTITREELETMRNIDLRNVDVDTLCDIRDVKINQELPKRERVLDFITNQCSPCQRCLADRTDI